MDKLARNKFKNYCTTLLKFNLAFVSFLRDADRALFTQSVFFFVLIDKIFLRFYQRAGIISGLYASLYALLNMNPGLGIAQNSSQARITQRKHAFTLRAVVVRVRMKSRICMRYVF